MYEWLEEHSMNVGFLFLVVVGFFLLTIFVSAVVYSIRVEMPVRRGNGRHRDSARDSERIDPEAPRTVRVRFEDAEVLELSPAKHQYVNPVTGQVVESEHDLTKLVGWDRV